MDTSAPLDSTEEKRGYPNPAAQTPLAFGSGGWRSLSLGV